MNYGHQGPTRAGDPEATRYRFRAQPSALPLSDLGLPVDESAIDQRSLSRHVVGIGAREERDERGDIFRRLRAAQRDALDVLLVGRADLGAR